jgi:hypothetical protein
MLALVAASSAFNGPALRTAPAQSHVQMAALDDLKTIAKEQNPVIGYWDPFNLALLNFWGQGEDATVGFLRHAEIKHGRVAMAGFVGFLVQANGIKFPWAPFDGITAASPCDQWDMLPEAAKYQIILFVGFLEVFSEHSYILEAQGEKHYMKGGKPGYFPSLKTGFGVHPVPFNLYDPFNFSANASPEKKAKGLNMEVNNGRLAMIGLMGFLAESKVPGSVPFGPPLPTYSGEVMAPFADKLWVF